MRRTLLRIFAAVSLIAIGWTAGQAAQQPQADFELRVSAPGGTTTITCVRGCGLLLNRYAPDKALAQPSSTYSCGTQGSTACSGTVHGWIIR